MGEAMTPQQFRAWRIRMGFSQAQAAEALGKKVLQVKRYEKPPAQIGAGAPYPVPRDTALACAALEAGLKPE